MQIRCSYTSMHACIIFACSVCHVQVTPDFPNQAQFNDTLSCIHGAHCPIYLVIGHELPKFLRSRTMAFNTIHLPSNMMQDGYQIPLSTEQPDTRIPQTHLPITSTSLRPNQTVRTRRHKSNPPNFPLSSYLVSEASPSPTKLETKKKSSPLMPRKHCFPQTSIPDCKTKPRNNHCCSYWRPQHPLIISTARSHSSPLLYPYSLPSHACSLPLRPGPSNQILHPSLLKSPIPNLLSNQIQSN